MLSSSCNPAPGDISNPNNSGLTAYDRGFVYLYDSPKDTNKLSYFFRRINLYADIEHNKTFRTNTRVAAKVAKEQIINEYETFLHRKYNDQTVSYRDIPEPLELGMKDDRVVFSGLERLAQLATGRSNNVFNDYGIGTGTTPVLPGDTELEFQEARVRIDETGFAESKGSSIVFAAIFPSTVPTISVSESGIFDNPQPPETMFLRTVYEGANVVEHTFNQTFVAVSHFVYLLSV